MKKLKAISVVLSLCMLLSLITPTLAADSSADKDTPSSWAAEKVALAIEAGIVPPHLQGDYKKDITRYEFAELIMNFVEIQTGFLGYAGLKKLNALKGYNAYYDINNIVSDYAFNLGIFYNNLINNDRKMNPDDIVLRQDMAYALYCISKYIAKHSFIPVENFNDESDADSYALEAISYVKSKGIINGTGYNRFEPKTKATREQAITTIYKLYTLEAMSFKDLKFDEIAYANNDVTIENDYFILHISKNIMYSKNIENEMLKGFKLAEKITGLSLYPEKYKDEKIILETNFSHNGLISNSLYSLDQGDLIINNNTNAVTYAEIAAKLLLERNKVDNLIEDFNTDNAYCSFIHYLANFNLKSNSKDPFFVDTGIFYYSSSDLSKYLNESFEDLIYYMLDIDENGKPITPYPHPYLKYLFIIFIYENYGMEVLNKYLLSLTFVDIKDDITRNEYIKKIFNENIKDKFIKWHNDNEFKYSNRLPDTYMSYDVYNTNGFIHKTKIIDITNYYKPIPSYTSHPARFSDFCFEINKNPITIDFREGYNFISYTGGLQERNNILLKCNSTINLKRYDLNGKLIDDMTINGSNNKFFIDWNYYYEITGSGLCEFSFDNYHY